MPGISAFSDFWRRSTHYRSGRHAEFLRLTKKDTVSSEDISSGGVLIMAASGSGKTTACLASLILAGHRSDASVLHTCVKSSDHDLWQSMASAAGRNDVRVFRLGRDTFNPVQFEADRPGSTLEDVVKVVVTPLKRRSRHGNGGDPYFQDEGCRYIGHILVPFLAAKLPVSFDLVCEVMNTLPRSVEDLNDPNWQASCPMFAAIKAVDVESLTPETRRDFERAVSWLLRDVPNTPDKQREGVNSTFQSATAPYIRGVIGTTLNSPVNTWDPNSVVENPCVTILDLPVQRDGEAAATVQRLLITATQRAVLDRPMHRNPQLVLLVCDEYQEFVDFEDDATFMRTGRDRRAAMVIATQSVGNIRSAAGSTRDPRAAADTILGIPSLKMFAATNDPDTLQWAGKVFVQTRQSKISFGTSETFGQRQDGSGESFGSNGSFSREFMDDVPAYELATLARGGPENRWRVEAMVSLTGRIWKSSGRPSLKVAFNQFRASP